MPEGVSTINPAGLHDPSAAGYSHVAVVPAGSGIAYISGQYASGADAKVVTPDFSGQVTQALQNLDIAITAAGGCLGGVAKLTVYVVDHSEERLSIFGKGLLQMFGECRPSITLVPVPKLAQADMLFEIEATVMVF